MNIAQVRAQYPQYQDLSDKQLADALHEKFYSDIPIQDYYGRIGLTSPKERTFGEAAKDIAAGVVSGAGSLVQLPGQLYGLATGNFEETGALGLGKDIAKYGEEMKSAGLKAREQERAQKIQTAEQKGQWEAFKTAFGETIKDPALLTTFLAEQAPQLLVPFGAAKIAQVNTAAKAAAAAQGLTGTAAREAVEAVTKAAAERGTKAAIGAGAVQQGADVGSQAYEDIYKELRSKGASDADAAQGALNLARAAGASGALISLLAQRLPGAKTLEESFAGVPGKGGRFLGALKGAAGEGLSEIAEETGGKFGANLAMREVKPEQSLLEGLGQTAGMAAVGGVGMGGVSGALRKPGGAEVAPPVVEAQPVAAPTVAPEAQTPEQVRQRVEEVTGISRAVPPSAEESVLGRLYKLSDAEAEAAREELTQKRLQRQQEQIDAEAERIAELNRRQGMPSPDRPKLEIEERPSIAEKAPELASREELLAKQAEVDQRRLEAGLPTGAASVTPGVEPTTPVAEEPKPVPKIVDNRPLTERAANNRLLVMRNMLQNQGGDPESLTIVPHPTVEGKFAIQSLDVPTKFTPDLPRTAIARPETPTIIDPVNAYVEIQRRTNTPAARRFVQDFDAGRITREDVERAIEQEQKAGQPQPLTYTSTGEPGIVSAPLSKPRGEREVPKLGEAPPKVETPPEEPPGEEPPTPKATLPQTLQEFEARMPIVFDKAEVREANNEGNFAKLTKALQLSSNPAIRRIGQLGAGIASKVTLRKPGRLGAGVAGVYRYADDSIQMIPDHAGNEHTNAHETLHALISKAQRYPTDRQKPIVADIEKLFAHVKKELKRKGVTAYGLTNVREFTAEAMTNPQFQFELMQLPYPGKKSSWTQFVKLVADLLGIQNTNALTEVMNLVDRLAQTKQPRKTVTDKGLVDESVVKAKEAPEAKSLGGERAQVQAFEQTLRSLLNKFGLKDVGLKILDGMTDSGSYAAQIIRIAADAANPIRTLRHEAIHALRELGFFTDAQWSSLSKMAKDKWIDQYLKQRNVDGKPLKAGEESRYDAYMREYNGDMEKITEEAVADAFADFDSTKPPAGMLQALLKRMKDLFQSIKSALTKVESPEQIFGKVEKGELKEGARETKGESKSLRDRATANFKRWFGDSKVVDEQGEPLVVYHGTNKDIATFKPGRGGGAIWFASIPELANLFVGGGRRNMGEGTKKGSAVYPVYLSIKKPLDLGNTSPQDNLSVADVLRMAKLPSGEQALRSIAQANLTSGYAFVTPSNSDPVGYLVSQYERNTNRASNTLDNPGLMDVLQAAGFDGLRMKEEGATTYAVFDPTNVKSAIGNNGDYSLTNADIRKSIGGRNPGEQAISIVNSLGMGVKPPEPGAFEKAKKILKGGNPDFTKESTKKSFQQLLDKIETMTFSADAAFNNELRRNLIRDMGENPEILGVLLEASQSQTVHADALASQFMIDGGLEYDDKLKKWHSVKKPDTFIKLANKIEEIAKKYGRTKEEMERIAHTYFVAKRLPSILKRNEDIEIDIAEELAQDKPDRRKVKELESLKVFVSDEQLAMMQPGLSLVDTIPELKQVVDIWQGIRQNNIDVLVNSGLWSPEYAQAMWDNIDYVPYYREEQLEEGAGPQEFIRGLQVKSKEFQLKGSGAAVNDVFDNMIRWSQSAMNRAIRAHKATQMIDAALKIDVGDRKMAVKVTEEKRGMNIARIFRDGKQELYDMADPLYVDAFSSIQNVSIPTLTFMSKLANVLRNSVVLYPMFSVAQVPQDSFAAMFSSGLKTQHALKIPYLAVKEFVTTLAKTSSTHKELVKFGVVGVRDFSATIVREDAEIYAGLKPPRGGWGKTKEFLSHIAMAADNAVRQAVYEASMQQGLDKSEALEKAFEIINFRRRGTSKMLNVMGQTVPFFYAYLSAQRVAYKTLSGVGISPTQRKEALTTLATTTAAVMTLAMLYAMANGDDEDYINTPAAVRDRTITIPGSGGVRIPLRPDFFLLPKLAAEHTYLLLTDKGYEDGAKFRTSVRDALVNAVASPLPVPQALKPLAEVAINYDFFQGKPILGQFEKNKDLGRQFNDSTSELSKLFGQTGLVSPILMDHLVRGMLGSAGGLTLFATNQFLHSDPDVPRPELSANEMLAALPGTSGFLKRPQESALKNDFYALRDEVEKAVNTFNDIKTRSPQGLQDFVADEKQMARYVLGKPVDQINRELAKIRKAVTQVTNMPESQMSAEKKAEFVRQMRDVEREMLKSVNVKQLREMAKI